MQPIKKLDNILFEHSDEEHFLWGAKDLKIFFPEMKKESFLKLINRACKAGILEHVCKGFYIYCRVKYSASRVIPFLATRLRGKHINYVSLESVLCANSIISQQMTDRITIMTTGRSGIFDCGKYGTIEFVHTLKGPESLQDNIHFDKWTKLLWASPKLAIEDMKDCHRKTLNLVENGD